MRILVVSPDFPYPATHGGRVDVFRRLEVLSQSEIEVDLAVCCKNLPDESSIAYMKNLVDEVFVVERSHSPLDSLFLEPYQVKSRKAFAEIHFNKTYDWVLLESEYVMEVLKNPTLKYSKLLLRVHNIEYKYYYQLFLSNIKKISSLYYLLEALRFYFYSNKAYKLANKLAFISIDELKFYNNTHAKFGKGVLLQSSFGISELQPYKYKPDNKTVLFVGALFMPNNIDGLNWYINTVHPQLLNDPEYLLVVAGSTGGDKTLKAKLEERLKQTPRLRLMCDVEDLSAVYNSSAVFINPMLKGAGIKIKTINAIQNGLPVVSTKTGAEGIGLENNSQIFITDSVGDFAAAVIKLLNDAELAAKMVAEAQNYLKAIDGKQILNLLTE